MDKQRYQKGGSAGSKGSQFQVHLLTVFLLNALRMRLPNWRLSTEDKRAGKFDDVVLEWSEGAVLLQAKHKENKKRITVEQLMSTNSKNDEFSIPKYFISYQDIKDTFPLMRKAVICTNASVNERALIFLNSQTDSSNGILCYEGGTCSFYTLKDGILSELKYKIRIYYRHITGRDIDETIITDENLKDFQKHFRIYFDYPSGDDLENVIEEFLNRTSWRTKASASEIYLKVLDWFQQKDGKFLKELHLTAMVSEIRRDKYWQSLKQYNVQFPNSDMNFEDSNRRYHFIAESTCLLQEMRIWQGLRGIGKKALYLHPDDTIEDQKHLIEAFRLDNYIVLVIVQPSISIVMAMWHQLEEILNNSAYKKLVLCTSRDNELVRLIQSSKNGFDVTKEPPTFEHLLEDTQDALLKSKKILFQGHVISLEGLFVPEPIRNYKAFLRSDVLERIVAGEEIRVGSHVPVLEAEVERSYIPRKFIRENEKRHEGNMFEASDKLILIADSPGMGKSTSLTKLALLIKESNPHLWVLKIVLDQYSKFLKDSLRKHKTMIDIMEFLDSQDITRLTSQLDKLVFSMDNKVVLMLDGIDEISPHYIELVESLLVNCLEASNFMKIFATTRPHLVKKLEEKFQVKSFAIEPFSQRKQLEFLKNYWLRNLEHSDGEKCEQYASALVQKMCLWTNSDFDEKNNFTAIPLQIQMTAEIFQESDLNKGVQNWKGCKEFLNSGRLEPKLPGKINLVTLYKLFMDKKQDVFIEKFNPMESAGAEQALADQYEESLAFHRRLALEVAIYEENTRKAFSCYIEGAKIGETNALKIGIIQQSDDSLRFVHRTFAEYFVAECLLIELQRHNESIEFQMFLIDKVLNTAQSMAICSFFDGLLQDYIDSLPPDIFRNYQSSSCNIQSLNLFKSCLVHDLAESGFVAILRLILKSIDFRIIKGKESSVICNRFRNTLNLVQYFVRREGINIKDGLGRTPVCLAAKEGHLEMVKFLMEQGANINITDTVCSPLYEAVSGGHLAVVEFLVEQGADIIGSVRKDNSEVYKAICRNHVPIVNYLLEKILEVVSLDQGLNAEYVMIPFAAAYLGRIDILKFLVERGMDTNTRIHNKQSLIFGAAMGLQFQAVKYLMEQGADISSRDWDENTVLHLISKNSSYKYMFKHFLNLGINIDVKNSYGMTPLHLAVEYGMNEMVEFLIRIGADVNSKYNFDGLWGYSILRTAALKNRLEVLKLLVEHGADVNVKDFGSRTLLHDVTMFGKLDVVKCLVQLGAEVTFEDENGDTALHLALLKNHLDIVKYFVEYGIDINSKNRDGHTYLHFIVSTMYNRAGNFLKDNLKPLFHDISSKRLYIVKYFVEHGANFNLKNNEDQTVLYLAILSVVLYCNTSSSCDQCLLVADFLIERGASIGIEGSIEDAKVALAKEIQKHKRYRREGLDIILQLPVFSLLDRVSPSTRKGAAPSTSVWVAEKSEVAPNTQVSEMAPADKSDGSLIV